MPGRDADALHALGHGRDDTPRTWFCAQTEPFATGDVN